MKQIVPIIMDSSFVKLAPIDDYISLIWTSRYYEVGDFELVVNANKVNMGLFVQGNYIMREDDENVGIIEDIKIQSNEDLSDMLIVTGRFLASILGRRIIYPQTNVNYSLDTVIDRLIVLNIIFPSILQRRILNFRLGTHSIMSRNVQAQFDGENLLETISELCKTYGVGMKVVLNSSHEFVFSLYEGADHTYNQSERPYIVFSTDYDNLHSSEYEENYRSVVTAVLVAGEGEGVDRKTAWATDGETGLNRYELYDDTKNISSNDGQISDADYQKLLEEAGKESLTRYTTAFSGSVSFDNIKYREDVNLGDLCVIENPRWGLSINARLLEVIESVAETGEYSIVPTFGV